MKEQIRAKIIQAINETDIDGYVRMQNGTGSFDSEGMQMEIVGRVWNAVMVDSNAFDGKHVKAEEVVLALRRKGVPATDIIYRKNKFLVKLPNATYNIYRSPEGDFRVFTISESGRTARIIGMEPEKFASLMLEFDSEVPEIKRHSSELVRKIKQETMTKWIREKTADAIVEEFLKGKNFSHFYWVVNDDGTVSVNAGIVEIREASITVPLEALDERLDEMNTQIEAMPRRIEEEPEEIDDVIGIPMRTNLKFQAGKLLRPCKIL